jgi:cystathionine beta-lyase/cystathionine gamma-synthase
MARKKDTLLARTRHVEAKNRPVSLPIYQTSTFEFETIGDLEKYLGGDKSQYLYTRYENPTLRSVQEKLAELEGGDSAYVFSSGMAAITSSLLAFLKAGDEVLASNSLYGRTQFFMERWLPRFGVKTRLIPVHEFPDIDRYFTAQTKIVYIETPTNPTLQIIDIAATAKAAHDHETLLLIDNTFASPINQNPIELGADIVLHSLTKYMAGHSDIIAGASIFKRHHEEAIREAIRTFGGSMDPFAGFLLERGLKTLGLRVQRQNATASFLAQRSMEHPKIKKVNYPGLKNHPGHEVAARQMRGFGGMLSFDLPDYKTAVSFVESLKVIIHAASLGGAESLVSLPILTSHYGQPPSNWEAAGITEGTVRVSVGLEDPDDLWQDIEQAL